MLASQRQSRPDSTPGFKYSESDENGWCNIEEDKDQEGGEKHKAGKERPLIEPKSLLTDGHHIVEGEDTKDDP